jgi:endonuclease-3
LERRKATTKTRETRVRARANKVAENSEAWTAKPPVLTAQSREQKAERIATILADFYPEPPIFLDHRDPYTLLIAVLLSAQCTDERVNKVTPELFAKADTPQAMAALPEAAILECIRSCGLAPSKAKNIRALSQTLTTQHGGVVPADWKILESLPGVGHKTAGVVMSQAFGEPAFPVDTHIHRLAARWGLSSGANVEQTETDLKRLFPRETWGVLHRRIILFGREHCPARTHRHETCPICSWAGEGAQSEEAARTHPF